MLPRNVSMSPQLLQDVLDGLKANPARLLALPEVRAAVARERLAPGTPVTVHQGGDGVMSATVDHNLAGLRDLTAANRADLLVNPLLALNDIRCAPPDTLDVLSIGPRTETEIFCLLANHFHGDRIRATDLMTYSSWIDTGDMHALPHADNSFDVVLMGWVLAYSKDKRRACAEALRVARPGAHIAVGCQYQPYTVEEWRQITSYQDYDMMFTCAQDVLDLFGDGVGKVVFCSDIEPAHKDKAGDIVVIFKVAKDDAAA